MRLGIQCQSFSKRNCFSYDEVLLLMDTEPAGAAVGDDCCRNSANIGFDSMTSLRTYGMNHSIRLNNSTYSD